MATISEYELAILTNCPTEPCRTDQVRKTNH
jgi:hypothetical protein